MSSSSPGGIWPCAMPTFSSGTCSCRKSLDLRQIGDARHDVEALAAAIALAQQRLADDQRVERRDEGAHRHAVDRRRGDQRQLAHAGQRQLQRARDRRRRQRQHMHVALQLLQPLLVLDAEMLLLVDDQQAEILERDRRCRAAHACRRRCRPCRRRCPSWSRRAPWSRPAATPAATCTGRPAKRSEKVLKCWRASSVVGTTTATCKPSIAATKAARSATSVLPKPTSPQISRSIGLPADEVVHDRRRWPSAGRRSPRRGSAPRTRRRALRRDQHRRARASAARRRCGSAAPAMSSSRRFSFALRDCQAPPPSLSSTASAASEP